MKKHNVNLPERPTGIRRYDNADYSFIKTDCKHPHVETHFGCPSCPTHFSELNDLRDHFINDHSEALSSSPQQENNDSEPHSSRKRSDEDIDTELLDLSCISFVPPWSEDHLSIHGFNATDAFYKLQLSVLTHKWKHSLEYHIHYALATNSILLLSLNQCPDDLSPFFNEHNLKAITHHV